MSDNTEQNVVEIQKPETKQELVPQGRAEVNSDESGILFGNTLESEYRICTMFLRSKMLPAQYDTPEKIIVGRQFARELNLKPLTALRQIAVVNGTPAMFGDLPLSVVRASGLLEYLQEFYFDEQGNKICFENKNLDKKIFGAACFTKRAGESNVKETTFTLKDAELAGLYPEQNKRKPWAAHTKLMLKYRARSPNLKDNFADVLNGMAIGEYDFDTTLDAQQYATVHEEKNVNAKRLLEEIKEQPTVEKKDCATEQQTVNA